MHKSKKQEVTTLIFDLGGVLLKQHLNSHLNTLKTVFNLPISNLEEFHRPLRDEWRKGKMNGNDYFTRLKNEYGLSGEVKSLIETYMSVYTAGARLDDEMLKLIKQLQKQYKVAVLSNIVDLHWQHAGASGLLGFIDNLYLSFNLGLAKPDSEIYEYVVSDLHVSAKECLFIDDLAENVLGATNSGMRGHVFTDYQTFKEFLVKEQFI